jgi:RNA polymerase sigma-70 factor (ECF subfamily)
MLPFLKKLHNEYTLIEGLRSGGLERRVYENNLYEAFFYFIKQGIHKYHLSEDDTASAYSDTIISVIHNIVHNKFEGRSSLKSYVYQIFNNKCVDLIRKETTNKNTVHHTSPVQSLMAELPDRTQSIIQEIIDKNEHSYLMQKINEIGEKCKQILLLFEDGYTDKEIAGTLHYNTADVAKTSRLRCIEKLKQKVLGSNRNYE